VRSPVLLGLAAGAAGTAAMTVSTTVEMRLRGRPPSLAPADSIERLTGWAPGSREGRERLGTAAHAAFGTALGLARGAIGALGLREPAASAAFLPVAWAPDLAVVPVLGAADPPWRWGAAELAISAWHHVVYVAAAGVAHEALKG
jgi:hypothetical protein